MPGEQPKQEAGEKKQPKLMSGVWVNNSGDSAVNPVAPRAEMYGAFSKPSDRVPKTLQPRRIRTAEEAAGKMFIRSRSHRTDVSTATSSTQPARSTSEVHALKRKAVSRFDDPTSTVNKAETNNFDDDDDGEKKSSSSRKNPKRAKAVSFDAESPPAKPGSRGGVVSRKQTPPGVPEKLDSSPESPQKRTRKDAEVDAVTSDTGKGSESPKKLKPDPSSPAPNGPVLPADLKLPLSNSKLDAAEVEEPLGFQVPAGEEDKKLSSTSRDEDSSQKAEESHSKAAGAGDFGLDEESTTAGRMEGDNEESSQFSNSAAPSSNPRADFLKLGEYVFAGMEELQPVTILEEPMDAEDENDLALDDLTSKQDLEMSKAAETDLFGAQKAGELFAGVKQLGEFSSTERWAKYWERLLWQEREAERLAARVRFQSEDGFYREENLSDPTSEDHYKLLPLAQVAGAELLASTAGAFLKVSAMNVGYKGGIPPDIFVEYGHKAGETMGQNLCRIDGEPVKILTKRPKSVVYFFPHIGENILGKPVSVGIHVSDVPTRRMVASLMELVAKNHPIVNQLLGPKTRIKTLREKVGVDSTWEVLSREDFEKGSAAARGLREKKLIHEGQEDAIIKILKNLICPGSLTFVRGPGGTGKTHLIVSLIAALPESWQVLFHSHTNVAMRQVALMLQNKLPILYDVSFSARADDTLTPVAAERVNVLRRLSILLPESIFDKLVKAQAELEEITYGVRAGRGKMSKNSRKLQKKLFNEVDHWDKQVSVALMTHAKAWAATNSCSYNIRYRFHLSIGDEAANSYPPSSTVPQSRCDHSVGVGDTAQNDPYAKVEELTQSQMGLLSDPEFEVDGFLTRCFRQTKKLLDPLNVCSYDGKLEFYGPPEAVSHPWVLYNVPWEEPEVPRSQKPEIQACMRWLLRMRKIGFHPGQIAVLSYYSNNKYLLQELKQQLSQADSEWIFLKVGTPDSAIGVERLVVGVCLTAKPEGLTGHQIKNKRNTVLFGRSRFHTAVFADVDAVMTENLATKKLVLEALEESEEKTPIDAYIPWHILIGMKPPLISTPESDAADQKADSAGGGDLTPKPVSEVRPNTSLKALAEKYELEVIEDSEIKLESGFSIPEFCKADTAFPDMEKAVIQTEDCALVKNIFQSFAAEAGKEYPKDVEKTKLITFEPRVFESVVKSLRPLEPPWKAGHKTISAGQEEVRNLTGVDDVLEIGKAALRYSEREFQAEQAVFEAAAGGVVFRNLLDSEPKTPSTTAGSTPPLSPYKREAFVAEGTFAGLSEIHFTSYIKAVPKTQFSAATYNVRSLASILDEGRVKLNGLLAVQNRQGVVALQETSVAQSNMAVFTQRFESEMPGYKLHLSSGPASRAGVGLITPDHFVVQQLASRKDGRFASWSIEIPVYKAVENEGIAEAEGPNSGFRTSIASVYHPQVGLVAENEIEKKLFQDELMEELNALKPEIVCGDWNIAKQFVGVPLDKNSQATNLDWEVAMLQNFESCGYQYCWTGGDRVISWAHDFEKWERNDGILMDHIHLRSDSVLKLDQAVVKGEFRYANDHAPVLATFKAAGSDLTPHPYLRPPDADLVLTHSAGNRERKMKKAREADEPEVEGSDLELLESIGITIAGYSEDSEPTEFFRISNAGGKFSTVFVGGKKSLPKNYKSHGILQLDYDLVLNCAWNLPYTPKSNCKAETIDFRQFSVSFSDFLITCGLYVEKAVSQILGAKEDFKVLIHCVEGLDRAPGIAICLLTHLITERLHLHEIAPKTRLETADATDEDIQEAEKTAEEMVFQSANIAQPNNIGVCRIREQSNYLDRERWVSFLGRDTVRRCLVQLRPQIRATYASLESVFRELPYRRLLLSTALPPHEHFMSYIHQLEEKPFNPDFSAVELPDEPAEGRGIDEISNETFLAENDSAAEAFIRNEVVKLKTARHTELFIGTATKKAARLTEDVNHMRKTIRDPCFHPMGDSTAEGQSWYDLERYRFWKKAWGWLNKKAVGSGCSEYENLSSLVRKAPLRIKMSEGAVTTGENGGKAVPRAEDYRSVVGSKYWQHNQLISDPGNRPLALLLEIFRDEEFNPLLDSAMNSANVVETLISAFGFLRDSDPKLKTYSYSDCGSKNRISLLEVPRSTAAFTALDPRLGIPPGDEKTRRILVRSQWDGHQDRVLFIQTCISKEEAKRVLEQLSAAFAEVRKMENSCIPGSDLSLYHSSEDDAIVYPEYQLYKNVDFDLLQDNIPVHFFDPESDFKEDEESPENPGDSSPGGGSGSGPSPPGKPDGSDQDSSPKKPEGDDSKKSHAKSPKKLEPGRIPGKRSGGHYREWKARRRELRDSLSQTEKFELKLLYNIIQIPAAVISSRSSPKQLRQASRLFIPENEPEFEFIKTKISAYAEKTGLSKPSLPSKYSKHSGIKASETLLRFLATAVRASDHDIIGDFTSIFTAQCENLAASSVCKKRKAEIFSIKSAFETSQAAQIRAAQAVNKMAEENGIDLVKGGCPNNVVEDKIEDTAATQEGRDKLSQDYFDPESNTGKAGEDEYDQENVDPNIRLSNADIMKMVKSCFAKVQDKGLGTPVLKREISHLAKVLETLEQDFKPRIGDQTRRHPQACWMDDIAASFRGIMEGIFIWFRNLKIVNHLQLVFSLRKIKLFVEECTSYSNVYKRGRYKLDRGKVQTVLELRQIPSTPTELGTLLGVAGFVSDSWGPDWARITRGLRKYTSCKKSEFNHMKKDPLAIQALLELRRRVSENVHFQKLPIGRVMRQEVRFVVFIDAGPTYYSFLECVIAVSALMKMREEDCLNPTPDPKKWKAFQLIHCTSKTLPAAVKDSCFQKDRELFAMVAYKRERDDHYAGIPRIIVPDAKNSCPEAMTWSKFQTNSSLDRAGLSWAYEIWRWSYRPFLKILLCPGALNLADPFSRSILMTLGVPENLAGNMMDQAGSKPDHMPLTDPKTMKKMSPEEIADVYKRDAEVINEYLLPAIRVAQSPAERALLAAPTLIRNGIFGPQRPVTLLPEKPRKPAVEAQNVMDLAKLKADGNHLLTEFAKFSANTKVINAEELGDCDDAEPEPHSAPVGTKDLEDKDKTDCGGDGKFEIVQEPTLEAFSASKPVRPPFPDAIQACVFAADNPGLISSDPELAVLAALKHPGLQNEDDGDVSTAPPTSEFFSADDLDSETGDDEYDLVEEYERELFTFKEDDSLFEANPLLQDPRISDYLSSGSEIFTAEPFKTEPDCYHELLEEALKLREADSGMDHGEFFCTPVSESKADSEIFLAAPESSLEHIGDDVIEKAGFQHQGLESGFHLSRIRRGGLVQTALFQADKGDAAAASEGRKQLVSSLYDAFNAEVQTWTREDTHAHTFMTTKTLGGPDWSSVTSRTTEVKKDGVWSLMEQIDDVTKADDKHLHRLLPQRPLHTRTVLSYRPALNKNEIYQLSPNEKTTTTLPINLDPIGSRPALDYARPERIPTSCEDWEREMVRLFPDGSGGFCRPVPRDVPGAPHHDPTNPEKSKCDFCHQFYVKPGSQCCCWKGIEPPVPGTVETLDPDESDYVIITDSLPSDGTKTSCYFSKAFDLGGVKADIFVYPGLHMNKWFQDRIGNAVGRRKKVLIIAAGNDFTDLRAENQTLKPDSGWKPFVRGKQLSRQFPSVCAAVRRRIHIAAKVAGLKAETLERTGDGMAKIRVFKPPDWTRPDSYPPPSVHYANPEEASPGLSDDSIAGIIDFSHRYTAADGSSAVGFVPQETTFGRFWSGFKIDDKIKQAVELLNAQGPSCFQAVLLPELGLLRSQCKPDNLHLENTTQTVATLYAYYSKAFKKLFPDCFEQPTQVHISTEVLAATTPGKTPPRTVGDNRRKRRAAKVVFPEEDAFSRTPLDPEQLKIEYQKTLLKFEDSLKHWNPKKPESEIFNAISGLEDVEEDLNLDLELANLEGDAQNPTVNVDEISQAVDEILSGNEPDKAKTQKMLRKFIPYFVGEVESVYAEIVRDWGAGVRQDSKNKTLNRLQLQKLHRVGGCLKEATLLEYLNGSQYTFLPSDLKAALASCPVCGGSTDKQLGKSYSLKSPSRRNWEIDCFQVDFAYKLQNSDYPLPVGHKLPRLPDSKIREIRMIRTPFGDTSMRFTDEFSVVEHINQLFAPRSGWLRPNRISVSDSETWSVVHRECFELSPHTAVVRVAERSPNQQPYVCLGQYTARLMLHAYRTSHSWLSESEVLAKVENRLSNLEPAGIFLQDLLPGSRDLIERKITTGLLDPEIRAVLCSRQIERELRARCYFNGSHQWEAKTLLGKPILWRDRKHRERRGILRASECENCLVETPGWTHTLRLADVYITRPPCEKLLWRYRAVRLEEEDKLGLVGQSFLAFPASCMPGLDNNPNCCRPTAEQLEDIVRKATSHGYTAYGGCQTVPKAPRGEWEVIASSINADSSFNTPLEIPKLWTVTKNDSMGNLRLTSFSGLQSCWAGRSVGRMDLRHRCDYGSGRKVEVIFWTSNTFKRMLWLVADESTLEPLKRLWDEKKPESDPEDSSSSRPKPVRSRSTPRDGFHRSVGAVQFSKADSLNPSSVIPGGVPDAVPPKAESVSQNFKGAARLKIADPPDQFISRAQASRTLKNNIKQVLENLDKPERKNYENEDSPKRRRTEEESKIFYKNCSVLRDSQSKSSEESCSDGGPKSSKHYTEKAASAEKKAETGSIPTETSDDSSSVPAKSESSSKASSSSSSSENLGEQMEARKTRLKTILPPANLRGPPDGMQEGNSYRRTKSAMRAAELRLLPGNTAGFEKLTTPRRQPRNVRYVAPSRPTITDSREKKVLGSSVRGRSAAPNEGAEFMTSETPPKLSFSACYDSFQKPSSEEEEFRCIDGFSRPEIQAEKAEVSVPGDEEDFLLDLNPILEAVKTLEYYQFSLGNLGSKTADGGFLTTEKAVKTLKPEQREQLEGENGILRAHFRGRNKNNCTAVFYDKTRQKVTFFEKGSRASWEISVSDAVNYKKAGKNDLEKLKHCLKPKRLLKKSLKDSFGLFFNLKYAVGISFSRALGMLRTLLRKVPDYDSGFNLERMPSGRSFGSANIRPLDEDELNLITMKRPAEFSYGANAALRKLSTQDPILNPLQEAEVDLERRIRKAECYAASRNRECFYSDDAGTGSKPKAGIRTHNRTRMYVLPPDLPCVKDIEELERLGSASIALLDSGASAGPDLPYIPLHSSFYSNAEDRNSDVPASQTLSSNAANRDLTVHDIRTSTCDSACNRGGAQLLEKVGYGKRRIRVDPVQVQGVTGAGVEQESWVYRVNIALRVFNPETKTEEVICITCNFYLFSAWQPSFNTSFILGWFTLSKLGFSMSTDDNENPVASLGVHPHKTAKTTWGLLSTALTFSEMEVSEFYNSECYGADSAQAVLKEGTGARWTTFFQAEQEPPMKAASLNGQGEVFLGDPRELDVWTYSCHLPNLAGELVGVTIPISWQEYATTLNDFGEAPCIKTVSEDGTLEIQIRLHHKSPTLSIADLSKLPIQITVLNPYRENLDRVREARCKEFYDSHGPSIPEEKMRLKTEKEKLANSETEGDNFRNKKLINSETEGDTKKEEKLVNSETEGDNFRNKKLINSETEGDTKKDEKLVNSETEGDNFRDKKLINSETEGDTRGAKKLNSKLSESEIFTSKHKQNQGSTSYTFHGVSEGAKTWFENTQVCSRDSAEWQCTVLKHLSQCWDPKLFIEDHRKGAFDLLYEKHEKATGVSLSEDDKLKVLGGFVDYIWAISAVVFQESFHGEGQTVPPSRCTMSSENIDEEKLLLFPATKLRNHNELDNFRLEVLMDREVMLDWAYTVGEPDSVGKPGPLYVSNCLPADRKKDLVGRLCAEVLAPNKCAKPAPYFPSSRGLCNARLLGEAILGYHELDLAQAFKSIVCAGNLSRAMAICCNGRVIIPVRMSLGFTNVPMKFQGFANPMFQVLTVSEEQVEDFSAAIYDAFIADRDRDIVDECANYVKPEITSQILRGYDRLRKYLDDETSTTAGSEKAEDSEDDSSDDEEKPEIPENELQDDPDVYPLDAEADYFPEQNE